ncbi:MAG: hypothetical protein ACOVNY_12830 [Chitinophagaceae bacterium]
MKAFALITCVCILYNTSAQYSKDSIYSDFVISKRRTQLNNSIHQRIIQQSFSKPFDSSMESSYAEACWAISQFIIVKPIVYKGFKELLSNYSYLQPSTKRSLIEAIYATYPFQFVREIQTLAIKETNSKLFAMLIVYLKRAANYYKKSSNYKVLILNKSKEWSNDIIFQQLDIYISNKKETNATMPSVVDWFKHQQNQQIKTVYSFQRTNRNFPGLAIVQLENGLFVRDAKGTLLVFEQLARSASNLPFFLTNGSTPQGVFTITGVDVSTNLFIGPTPNLQLIMPFENDSIFFEGSSNNTLEKYQQLLPKSWQNYSAMYETFYAGKIGRTEIIAHGTTIDVALFKNQSYYPFTPTLGCLCAKEIWNETTGKLVFSDQINLVNAFLQTTTSKGKLIVININNEAKAVTKNDIEKWVIEFEKGLK